jgi:hypothetical protein
VSEFSGKRYAVTGEVICPDRNTPIAAVKPDPRLVYPPHTDRALTIMRRLFG